MLLFKGIANKTIKEPYPHHKNSLRARHTKWPNKFATNIFNSNSKARWALKFKHLTRAYAAYA